MKSRLRICAMTALIAQLMCLIYLSHSRGPSLPALSARTVAVLDKEFSPTNTKSEAPSLAMRLAQYLRLERNEELFNLGLSSADDVGNCSTIFKRLDISSIVQFRKGTVKLIQKGLWLNNRESWIPVAVNQLRDPKYNGDFSSGLARLK